MNKSRFLATLTFARQIKHTKTDDTTFRLVLSAYSYGYTCGWQDRDKEVLYDALLPKKAVQ